MLRSYAADTGAAVREVTQTVAAKERWTRRAFPSRLDRRCAAMFRRSARQKAPPALRHQAEAAPAITTVATPMMDKDRTSDIGFM